MNIGDTFQVTIPGTSYDSHLWMVISDPEQSHFVLIVNFTSYREDKDLSCIVDVGDHPYIRKTSVVNYGSAKYEPINKLMQLLENGSIRAHDPISDDLLTRILDGSSNSPDMNIGHWDILNEQGLIIDEE